MNARVWIFRVYCKQPAQRSNVATREPSSLGVPNLHGEALPRVICCTASKFLVTSMDRLIRQNVIEQHSPKNTLDWLMSNQEAAYWTKSATQAQDFSKPASMTHYFKQRHTSLVLECSGVRRHTTPFLIKHHKWVFVYISVGRHLYAYVCTIMYTVLHVTSHVVENYTFHSSPKNRRVPIPPPV